MDDDELDEEKKKTRTVRYHKHGSLNKVTNLKTGNQSWVFEGPDGTNEYEGEGFELVDIFDGLSKEGYELVCGHDEEFILRTKLEIEEIEEYWDDVDL